MLQKNTVFENCVHAALDVKPAHDMKERCFSCTLSLIMKSHRIDKIGIEGGNALWLIQ